MEIGKVGYCLYFKHLGKDLMTLELGATNIDDYKRNEAQSFGPFPASTYDDLNKCELYHQW